MLLASPEELVYYGARRRALEQIRFTGNLWSGGAPGGGYFGWERPSAELRNWVIDWFFATTGEPPPPPPA